jgi:ubiquinone/menaquinone biosynthesis C-methylase UbiE
MSLEDFYNDKYKNQQIRTSVVSIVKNPKDRFEMAELIAKNYGGKYLEIGAGSGLVAAKIERNYERIVLTEMSDVRAKKLRETFMDNNKISIVYNDIEKDSLAYPDNYFNVVVMLAVIEHLIDPISALKKIYQKLSKGGILILDTPNVAKWTNRIKLLFGRFPSTASTDEGLLCYDKKTPVRLYDEGHLHYFTLRSISKILMEFVGFNKIKYYGYGSILANKSPYFLAKLLPKLFSDIFVVASK